MKTQSEHINEIAAALAKAQGVMEPAKFDKEAGGAKYKFKYASLGSVIDAIKKPLSDNGISYTHTVEQENNTNYLVTKLIHSSGQFISTCVPILLPKSDNAIQAFGSALTYLKRYSLSALVGISSEEDDDANSCEEKEFVEEKPKTQQKPAEAPKINAEDVQWIKDMLNFYGENVSKRFWEELKKSNKHRVEDIPLSWAQGTKDFIQRIIAEESEK